MKKSRVNLAGFGIDDEYLMSIDMPDLEIMRKGEIWRKATDQKFEEI